MSSSCGQDGAELHFEEPVTRWEELPGGAGVRVHTPENTYTAGQLVICPGAWAPQLLTDLGVPFTIERQVMYWFAPDGGTAPFVPDQHPIYIWEDAQGVQIYGFPSIDGPDGGAKVAFFRKGTVCTPETIERTVHDHEVRAMADQLAPRIPALPGRFLKAATCMYSNTPDEHFVITRHPAHPETVTVACGFSGHGFKFVPVVGEIVADLALTGATAHPIELFDPAGPPPRPLEESHHDDHAHRVLAGTRHARDRCRPEPDRHPHAATTTPTPGSSARSRRRSSSGCGSARSAAPTWRSPAPSAPSGSAGRAY